MKYSMAHHLHASSIETYDKSFHEVNRFCIKNVYEYVVYDFLLLDLFTLGKKMI